MRTPRVLIPVVAALSAGCLYDTPTTSEADVALGPALANAAGLLGTYGNVASPSTYFGYTQFPLGTRLTRDCTYDNASQYFVCPLEPRGDFTMLRTYQLLDAQAAVVVLEAPESAAGVHAVTDWSGTIFGEPSADGLYNVAVARLEDVRVMRETNGTLRIAGKSTLRVRAQRTHGSRVTTTGDTTETTDFRVPIDSAAFPTGVLTFRRRSTTVDGASTLVTERTGTMTFDGTKIVVIQRSTGGPTTTCTYDLSTKRTAC